MNEENQINYVEMPSTDLTATKSFFTAMFGWEFQDWGPDYCSFNDGRLDGGFFRSDKVASTEQGSALIVFYANDLEASAERVKANGGSIVKDIFSFPGGRRFHFADPTGNEFAIWSDR